MGTDFERAFELGQRYQRLLQDRDDMAAKIAEQTGAHARCKEALREANETISALQESLARHEKVLREAEAPRKIVSDDAVARRVFEHLVHAYECGNPGHKPVLVHGIWRHPPGAEQCSRGSAILSTMDYLYPNGAPEGANEP